MLGRRRRLTDLIWGVVGSLDYLMPQGSTGPKVVDCHWDRRTKGEPDRTKRRIAHCAFRVSGASLGFRSVMLGCGAYCLLLGEIACAAHMSVSVAAVLW